MLEKTKAKIIHITVSVFAILATVGGVFGFDVAFLEEATLELITNAALFIGTTILGAKSLFFDAKKVKEAGENIVDEIQE